MGEVCKGVVTAIEKAGVRVRPYAAGSSVTPPLTYHDTASILLEQLVPVTVESVRVTVGGSSGTGTGTGHITVPVTITGKIQPPLKINDVVLYVLYEDGTGMILSKL